MAVNLEGFESSLVWDAVARESCPEKFESDTVPLLDSSPELLRNFVGELFCYSCRRCGSAGELVARMENAHHACAGFMFSPHECGVLSVHDTLRVRSSIVMW